MDGDSAADGADGGDHGHQQEGRKKRSEGRPEIEIEARPFSCRNAGQGSFRDPVCVVEAEEGGDARADHNTDDRRPEERRPSRLQRDAGDDHHQQRRAQRLRQRRASLRHGRKQIEHGRHHCDRYQHDDRSRDGRREHPVKQRKPRGQYGRNEGRDDDHGREQRRTSGRDGRDEGPEAPITTR